MTCSSLCQLVTSSSWCLSDEKTSLLKNDFSPIRKLFYGMVLAIQHDRWQAVMYKIVRSFKICCTQKLIKAFSREISHDKDSLRFDKNKYLAAVINHARLIFPANGHAQESNNISRKLLNCQVIPK